MNIQYQLTELAQKLISQGIDVRPIRGSTFAAGMDLCACIEEPVTIYPGVITKIYTGIKVYLGEEPNDPVQLAGLYLPRSSNSEMVLANTIGLLDADFQGESFVKLTARNESFVVKPGDRLVQLVVIPTVVTTWDEVSEFSSTTQRGEGGDGSTGGNYIHG